MPIVSAPAAGRSTSAVYNYAVEAHERIAPSLQSSAGISDLQQTYRSVASSMRDHIARADMGRQPSLVVRDEIERHTAYLSVVGPLVQLPASEIENPEVLSALHRTFDRRLRSLRAIAVLSSPALYFRRWALPQAGPEVQARAELSMLEFQRALTETPLEPPSRHPVENLSARFAAVATVGEAPVHGASTERIFEEIFALQSPAERGESLRRVVAVAEEMRLTRETLNQALHGLSPREMHIILTQLRSFTAT